MQDRDASIPKEVASWIKERMEKYPSEVDFVLHFARADNDNTEYAGMVKKYSRFYNMRGTGVMSVVFPYLQESWYVKIMVGADKEGNILNIEDPLWNEKFDIVRTNILRNEIANLPAGDGIEKIKDAYAIKRRPGEPALEKPDGYENFLPRETKGGL